ncbi:hypothetical protein RRG08_009407 [Elysia crispata]|uniref:Uncharacterized protein n=1 Tax=Elysia crispata TaxID=231223 RepID=A0AAE1DVX0_9GAST|nr:hypothetical protein RRG08_009407 [Elysia crispata]
MEVNKIGETRENETESGSTQQNQMLHLTAATDRTTVRLVVTLEYNPPTPHLPAFFHETPYQKKSNPLSCLQF